MQRAVSDEDVRPPREHDPQGRHPRAGIDDDQLEAAWRYLRQAVSKIDAALTAETLHEPERDLLICLLETPGHELPMSTLALRLRVRSGSVTKIVDPLVVDELVARRRSLSDRRVIHAVLTTAGVERASGHLPARRRVLRRHIADALGEPSHVRLLAASCRTIASFEPSGPLR